MKFFVTGGEGFVGSHLVEELVLQGHEVTVLAFYNSFGTAGWVDSFEEEVRGSVRVVHGDIRDYSVLLDAMAGHEAVIHLAALISIPYSYQAPRSYFETNVLGTHNVMEAARRVGVRRVIHTSTSEVYGSAQYVPMDETHPLVGQSPYSASKIGADQVAHSFWASFDVPVTTVRPFNIYGPRQSQRAFIPSVIVQVLSGRPVISVGTLTSSRDLTFVADAVRGFRTVAEKSTGLGETYNMGSGFEVSMGEVAEMLGDISGSKISVSEEPSRVRPVNSEVERLWSDSSKIEGEFGWKPAHIGIDGLHRGLEKTYKWFENHFRRAGYDPGRTLV